MALKPILPFGDPVLRKTSKPVTKFDENLFQLLNELRDILYAEEGRAGLAAPQIGVLQRVIVMDCGDGLIELINPKILARSGQQTGTEGCLSFPGHSGVVTRAQHVKIKTLDREGHEKILEGEDLLARCMQHEIDHLDGILYIDRIQGDELYNDLTEEKVNLPEILAKSKPKP
ncbi:MAG TPA: peptide deformylase [Bacillota bacterium]|nr:peptide deformylase [Bacillota bacterium]